MAAAADSSGDGAPQAALGAVQENSATTTAAASSEAASGDESGSGSRRISLSEETAAAAALPPPLLSRQDAQALVRQLYKAKAAQDIAVARGQRPFTPLPEFVGSYFQLQYGLGMAAAEQRLAQLGASVRAHAAAGCQELALFGLAAGLLTEDELAAAVAAAAVGAQQQQQGTACGEAAEAEADGALLVMPALPPVLVRQDTAQSEQRSCSPPSPSYACGPSRQTTAKAPLVLYHSRRQPAAQRRGATLGCLDAFRHSRWHAAYLRSATRRLGPPPNPLQLLHSVCGEVAELLQSVPGVGELLEWVQGGGVAAAVQGADLGMPLAESQASGARAASGFLGASAVGLGGGPWLVDI